MKKYLLIIVLIIPFILCGCTDKNEKIYLSDKYYRDGVYLDVHSSDIDNLKNDNYLLFIYNPYCNFKIPCDKVFEETMDKYKIDILSMAIEEYKKTELFNTVRYAPSILVIKKGKIIAYLDANNDDHLDLYQDSNKFEEWLSKYVYLEKKSN